ncbi:MAG: type II toxin-antitoxin system HicB family antitoxin [Oscillospiraceae bacterium]|nr:type II toxin-antitoxin system HicB family antitoxin [Oscillospiraceae bacterium]
MAKKSFIDRGNPALQFISATREEVPEKKAAEEVSSAKSAGKKGRGAKKEKAPERERQAAQSAQPVESAQTALSVGGEVKADMTAQPSAVDSAAGSNKPETVVRSGHPVAPRRQGESKSKRVQLLVPPSLHMRVARKAAAMDMSFNEYVNQVLEKSCGDREM